ncbi:hypothetical protein BDW59DRAFT_157003 [Aspergillus cavernicola]|uniref:Uncharacterized protein n=1 Tax=Aspergillus cavernicola TaxID=176166 RepID=A0ABR4IYY3_9EURO
MAIPSTLAPTAKIPSLALKLRIDHETYDSWAKEYILLVEDFYSGVYQTYLNVKAALEAEITIAFEYTLLNEANMHESILNPLNVSLQRGRPHGPPNAPPNLRLNPPPQLPVFDGKYVYLPVHIEQSIPQDITFLFNKCYNTANRAYNYLKAINCHRQLRFIALCPQDNLVRAKNHALAINRLICWRADFEYDFYDPTLAPTPPMSGEDMTLCISSTAYDKWAGQYHEAVERFLNTGQWWAYCQAKVAFEAAMVDAQGSGGLGDLQASELALFWRNRFLVEMGRSEKYVDKLGVPSFKDLIEELHWTLVLCVENGEMLFHTLHLNSVIEGLSK